MSGFKMVIGEKGKKYGLMVPKKKVAPMKPMVANIFNQDDTEEIESSGPVPPPYAISGGKLNKVQKEATAAALAEDPTVFEYDEVFDDMKKKEKQTRRAKKDAKRESKYIKQLLSKAAERKLDDDLYYEKKLLREQREEQEEYGDKEKFITSGYRKQMEESKRWLAEREKIEAEREKHSVATAGSSALFANILNGRLDNGEETDSEKEEDQQTEVKEETKEDADGHSQATTAEPAQESASTVSNKRLRSPSDDNLDVKLETAIKEDDTVKELQPGSRYTQGWDASIPKETLQERQKAALAKESKHDDESKMSARERYLARKKAKLMEK